MEDRFSMRNMDTCRNVFNPLKLRMEQSPPVFRHQDMMGGDPFIGEERNPFPQCLSFEQQPGPFNKSFC